jgi:hypothetical protein
MMLEELDKDALEPKHRNQCDESAHGHWNSIMEAFTPLVDGIDLPALGADGLDAIAENAGGRK